MEKCEQKWKENKKTPSYAIFQLLKKLWARRSPTSVTRGELPNGPGEKTRPFTSAVFKEIAR